MNLILFEADEIARPLPRSDPRARHLLDVLRRQPGDVFDAGIVNARRGRATLTAVTADALQIHFEPGPALPPLPSTALLIGLPRPQTARDVLRDATTLGATELHFVATARSDPNYAASSLWSDGGWRRHLLEGAAQAFDPRLPEVTRDRSLASAVAAGRPAGTARYALDNYEAEVALAAVDVAPAQPVVLALGPERGWDGRDRELLRQHGYRLAHLGPRVLRVETAVIAALTLVAARREGA